MTSLEIFDNQIDELEYRNALLSFDKNFEYSDDRNYWAEQRARLAALRARQQEIDPDGRIWRSIFGDRF